MGDGRLVYAVELRIVHLVGIAECGGRGRQPLTCRPHARIVTAAPESLGPDQLLGLRSAAAGEADAQRIEYEGLGGVHRSVWEIPVASFRHMLSECRNR